MEADVVIAGDDEAAHVSGHSEKRVEALRVGVKVLVGRPLTLIEEITCNQLYVFKAHQAYTQLFYREKRRPLA